MTLRRLLALLMLASTAACTHLIELPPAPATMSAEVNTAPAQPIRANVVRPTRVFESARGRQVLCEVAPSAVSLVRFEAGRFLAKLDSGDACGATTRDGIWIAAADVAIDDAAYAPALVRVHEQPGLRLEMSYAGPRAFCDDRSGRCLINEPLYAQPRCYVTPALATRLENAARALHERDADLRLVVLDCYRPIYVQERMFALVANPTWVARPTPPRYGGHNRGVAIDVTLERSGDPLDMGSPFDAFDDRSRYDFVGLSDSARSNRALLRQLMTSVGLRPYDGEWWHYSLGTDTPALNLPL